MSEKSSESLSGSGAMSSRSSKGAFIVPVYKFAIIVDQISIIDRKVTIIKQHSLELTEDTANVVDICRLAAQKSNISKPVILNCNFEKIENETYHRGEVFWNRRFRYYLTSNQEWLSLSENGRVMTPRARGVMYPITPACLNLKRSKSAYWPVTMPRTFRRSFVRVKVHKNNLLFKNLPIELNEFIANIDDIKQIIKDQYGMQDPIVLDRRYIEIRDDPRTRGEAFWNSNQNFYFLERFQWLDYERKRSKSRESSRIEYATYFDRSRSTYYKRKSLIRDTLPATSRQQLDVA